MYLYRWKQCVALVNEGFGLVAAHLYVTKMASNWTNTWVPSAHKICFLARLFDAHGASKHTADIAANRRTKRGFRRQHRTPRVDRRGDDSTSTRESKTVSNFVTALLVVIS